MEETIVHTPEPDDDNGDDATPSTPDTGLDSEATMVGDFGGADNGGAVAALDAPRNPLQLAWHAILFKEDAFLEVRDSESPIRKGLTALVIVLVIAAIGSAIGQVIGFAVSPPMEAIRQAVLGTLLESPQIAELRSDPEAFAFFNQLFEMFWNFFSLFFPSLRGAGIALCASPILGLVGWVIYGLLTQVSAKILGGKGEMPQFLGAFALAYAPSLLNVALILPGIVLSGLVGWWILATSYLAVKTTHDLTWGRALLAVLLPRIVVTVLIVGCSVVLGFTVPALFFGEGG